MSVETTAVNAGDRPDELIAAVRSMADSLARFDDAACSAFGVGRTDLRALNLMENGPVTAGELAVGLGLTSGTVTVLIDRLVERGYVLRERSQDDRRKVHVRLEPATYAAFARIYAPCGQAVTAATAQMSPRQRATARQALLLITAAVSEQEQDLRDSGMAVQLSSRDMARDN